MAPIEPDLYNSNLRPLSIFGGYLVLASSLTGLISYDILYKAFRALPPSQDTRHRQSNREKHLQLFVLLASISLAITWYRMLQYFALSYRVWAHEMGEILPPTLWDENGYIAFGTLRISLGRWLKDTSLFRDAWEIVIERSRRYWWSQQIFLGAASWSVFVGIEGRRRNIRHLWAFLLLGQIIAVSFAMNLFFLAILLTPVPLPPRSQNQIEESRAHKRSSSMASAASTKTVEQTQTTIRRVFSDLKNFLPPLITRPHPPEWNPHPAAIIAPVTALYACAFLLPFSVSTPQFWSLLIIPHLMLFGPLYLDRLAPIAYGSKKHPHRTYLVVYRFLSYASFLLYLKQSFVALLDNDPGAYEHRHSHYLASLHLPHEQERGTIMRTTSSVSLILGSLSDHPAVASVGWDVLMCAISLATWAVIRGLDISRIVGAAVLPMASSSKHGESTSSSTHARSSSITSNGSASSPPGPKARRRRKPSTKIQGDGDFSPSEVVDPIVFGEEEKDENLEAGAVSGALFALGGLGVLASGVLGAEFET